MAMSNRIIKSDFFTSIAKWPERPTLLLPEAVFVGRSNAGKSTLLNSLCHRSNLAITSKTPGRTRLLNYFHVVFRSPQEEDFSCHFVDSPGYGYARAAKSATINWGKFMSGYLFDNPNLRIVVLLLDSRRLPEEEEIWFARNQANWELIVALTKADKLSKNEQQKQLLSTSKLMISPKNNLKLDDFILLSSLKASDPGLAKLTARLAAKLCSIG